MIYIPTDSATTMLEALRAAILDGLAIARCFKNNLPLEPPIVASDFVEADFGGYAPISGLDYSPASAWAPLEAWTKGQTCVFASDGTPPANLVYGIYVTTAAGALLYVEKYDTGPKVMASIGDVIIFTHVLHQSLSAGAY